MTLIRYHRYVGELWDDLDLGELVGELSDFLLQSGFYGGVEMSGVGVKHFQVFFRGGQELFPCQSLDLQPREGGAKLCEFVGDGF